MVTNCLRLSNPFFCIFIGQCTGSSLRQIDLGSQTGITDEAMRKIFLLDTLTNLEEFHCEKSSTLTADTANMLIDNCDNLKAISDLQNWSSLEPSFLGSLMER